MYNELKESVEMILVRGNNCLGIMKGNINVFLFEILFSSICFKFITT